MKCLVVDDDPVACQLVREFLGRIGGIEYCLEAGDGSTALHLIAAEPFDAIFLDLQLPGIDGQSLLQALPREVPVVVVSASADFGARSYDFGVIDYLVKPFGFSRFAKAVARVRMAAAARAEAPTGGSETIFLRDGGKIVRIDLGEVSHIQAQSNYAAFVFDDGRSVLSLVSMRKLEGILPDHFIRIHRSYIVNRDRIRRIENSEVFLDKHRLAIGESYRPGLAERLGVIN